MNARPGRAKHRTQRGCCCAICPAERNLCGNALAALGLGNLGTPTGWCCHARAVAWSRPLARMGRERTLRELRLAGLDVNGHLGHWPPGCAKPTMCTVRLVKVMHSESRTDDTSPWFDLSLGIEHRRSTGEHSCLGCLRNFVKAISPKSALSNDLSEGGQPDLAAPLPSRFCTCPTCRAPGFVKLPTAPKSSLG